MLVLPGTGPAAGSPAQVIQNQASLQASLSTLSLLVLVLGYLSRQSHRFTPRDVERLDAAPTHLRRRLRLRSTLRLRAGTRSVALHRHDGGRVGVALPRRARTPR